GHPRTRACRVRDRRSRHNSASATASCPPVPLHPQPPPVTLLIPPSGVGVDASGLDEPEAATRVPLSPPASGRPLPPSGLPLPASGGGLPASGGGLPASRPPSTLAAESLPVKLEKPKLLQLLSALSKKPMPGAPPDVQGPTPPCPLSTP